VGKDFEGGSCELCSGSIPTFPLEDQGKPVFVLKSTVIVKL